MTGKRYEVLVNNGLEISLKDNLTKTAPSLSSRQTLIFLSIASFLASIIIDVQKAVKSAKLLFLYH